jgi:DNA-binding transcriptional LysR family regulator
MPRPAVRLSAIDLNLLVVFDAVMRERNVTRAAQRLGLSQPATSHALARLRHMLKDELFIPTPTGMEPTPRAKELSLPLREVLIGLEQAIEPVSFDPSTARTHFRVGVDSYSAVVLAHVFARHVLAAAPCVLLDLKPTLGLNVSDLLENGELDLAAGTFAERRDRFSRKTLLSDEFVAVLHRDHPFARKPEMTLEDFAEIPQIEITSVPYTTDFIDEFLAKHGLRRRVVLQAPDITAMLLLLEGEFVVVALRRAVEILSPHHPCAVRRLPMPSPVMETALMWPRRLDRQPSQQWLRQELCKVAAGLPRTVGAPA